ncbi:MAG: transporter substrate-binding domain-containing protein [Acholeplasmataceae bacterium]|nr:transporter substrate-binding domain-containing protein [Acholeplasmataceae bacterium]
MKKMLGLVLIVVTLFVLAGCQSNVINNWEDIEDRGYFIVGLDDTFAPMGFRDTSGNLVGFDVDLAKEVARRLNIEVRFQPIDWDAKVLELNSGKIDMIWNGLTITEARLEEMLFSNPYIANTQMIMVSSDSTINLISDLVGKKVGVQISSAAEEAVNANSIVSSLGELLKYDQYNQALLELKNGTIDAVVIDEIMGRYIISQSNGEYRVASENFAEETYGVGFRLESDSIRDQINQVLLEMIEDGKASEISMQWFDEDIFLR